MIFPGFPGVLSFFQVFQVFQVEWEPWSLIQKPQLSTWGAFFPQISRNQPLNEKSHILKNVNMKQKQMIFLQQSCIIIFATARFQQIFTHKVCRYQVIINRKLQIFFTFDTLY